ncbi:DUF481 domain-containing protein [Flavobacteriaceae sp. LMIT009]
MKSIKLLFLVLLLSTSFSNAQMILNAESLRVNMLKGKEDWSGRAGLNFGFIKNTNDIYLISTNLAVGYNGGKNLWMIISNFHFQKVGENAFQNSGVQHFRYNRELTESITFEAFLQGQFDKISSVDFRGLAGAGARFKLTKNLEIKSKVNTNNYVDTKAKKSRIYLGALIMHEYEKSFELEIDVKRKDFRSSNYLSFSLFPTDQISIISTTYYQPRLDKFKDYRVSSTLNLNISFSSKKEESFWDKLSFNMNFSYNYDAFPVISIPKTQYSLTNGFSFNF